jgi:hypothetical protein
MNDPNNRNYIAEQAIRLEMATQTSKVDLLLIRIGIATKLLKVDEPLTPEIAGQVVQFVASFKRSPGNRPSLEFWRRMLSGQGKRKKSA